MHQGRSCFRCSRRQSADIGCGQPCKSDIFPLPAPLGRLVNSRLFAPTDLTAGIHERLSSAAERNRYPQPYGCPPAPARAPRRTGWAGPKSNPQPVDTVSPRGRRRWSRRRQPPASDCDCGKPGRAAAPRDDLRASGNRPRTEREEKCVSRGPALSAGSASPHANRRQPLPAAPENRAIRELSRQSLPPDTNSAKKRERHPGPAPGCPQVWGPAPPRRGFARKLDT